MPDFDDSPKSGTLSLKICFSVLRLFLFSPLGAAAAPSLAEGINVPLPLLLLLLQMEEEV